VQIAGASIEGFGGCRKHRTTLSETTRNFREPSHSSPRDGLSSNQLLHQ